MTFLPIVDRELRIRARWKSTYWVRGAVALTAILIAGVMLLFAGMAAPGAVGKPMFAILAWLAWLFCLVEGVRNTADCLSEEKREGTLGLLFLTDLKGYDVVLGKFMASSLSSFYGLLAMVPALAIPLLLGGVTGGEFWRVVLALVNTLFFALTTGMFVSSISRQERKAWVGTFGLTLLFVVVLPLLAAALALGDLGLPSPWSAFTNSFESEYTGAPEACWYSNLFLNLLSWLWLALASYLLPRSWQEKAKQRRTRRTPGAVRQGAARRHLMEINPVLWLTARHEHQRIYLWLTVGLAIAAGGMTWVMNFGDWSVLAIMFGFTVVLNLALCVWVAAEASHSFGDARASGALELLLSTPMTVRQIIRGQDLALRRLFLPPIAALLGFELLVLVAQLVLLAAKEGEAWGSVAALVVALLTVTTFALDLCAVSRVGMWFGLTSRKPTQALTKTVLFVLVLPLAGSLFCFLLGSGLLLAKSIIFLTWAHGRLHNDFRLVATQRFDVTPRAEIRSQPAPPTLSGPG